MSLCCPCLSSPLSLLSCPPCFHLPSSLLFLPPLLQMEQLSISAHASVPELLIGQQPGWNMGHKPLLCPSSGFSGTLSRASSHRRACAVGSKSEVRSILWIDPDLHHQLFWKSKKVSHCLGVVSELHCYQRTTTDGLWDGTVSNTWTQISQQRYNAVSGVLQRHQSSSNQTLNIKQTYHLKTNKQLKDVNQEVSFSYPSAWVKELTWVDLTALSLSPVCLLVIVYLAPRHFCSVLGKSSSLYGYICFVGKIRKGQKHPSITLGRKWKHN